MYFVSVLATTEQGFSVAQMEAVLRGGRSSREGELCVQAVFSLLDTLKLWLEDARPSLLANTGAGTTSERAHLAVFEKYQVSSSVSSADLLEAPSQTQMTCQAAALCKTKRGVVVVKHGFPSVEKRRLPAKPLAVAPADSAQTDGTGVTYEAAVAAVPTVKHVQDLVDSIPRVSRLPICPRSLSQLSIKARLDSYSQCEEENTAITVPLHMLSSLHHAPAGGEPSVSNNCADEHKQNP